MSEKDWRIFVTVAEEGNITKAAEKLFLSQPALSYRLRHLEELTETELLVRTATGILLTPAGEVYYQYCRRMLKEEEKLKQHMERLEGGVQGKLDIASSINFADYELPVMLRSFTKQYPNIHIRVKTGYSRQVSKQFNAGDCMVAIVRGNYTSSANCSLLFEEPYCLAYHKKATYEELKTIPYISYRSDTSIYAVIDDWCSENLNFPVVPAMELDSMSTCRHFVREGLGWTILPFMGLGWRRDERLYIEPLKDKEGNLITRSTYLLYNEENLNLVTVNTFVNYVKKYYEGRGPLE